MAENKIPYKIYLDESEIPTKWYNVRADMKNKPAPLLNPATLKPMTHADLAPVFCDELIDQELDDTDAYIDIPEEIQNFYKMYRPSPLIRAYFLEKALDTPAKIYYKFEGNNTSGSHKLNSAIAQAYYAKKQGLKGVTTETGAGQWGTALSMACSYFGLDCKVFMVKVSYEQKPFRREVMTEPTVQALLRHRQQQRKSAERFLRLTPVQQEALAVLFLRLLRLQLIQTATVMYSEVCLIRYFFISPLSVLKQKPLSKSTM